jgi:nucleotide-binding universal stress UspA family protein
VGISVILSGEDLLYPQRVKSALLPVDFSQNSRKLVEEALSYLQERKAPCRVLLLNTYLIPRTPFDRLLEVHDELRKKSTNGLEEELERIRAIMTSPEIAFEILSYMGSLENVIVYLAEERKVDCIILGKEDGNLRKSLLSRLDCAILTLPFPSSFPVE